MNAPLRLRPSLLLGCAASALAWPAAAGAQAFQATPATVAGTVTYSRGTPGIETIQVNSDTAIINWRPTGSPVSPYEFLPAGNVATFTNGPANADFVVLNRILVTVPVRFDGHVISQLVTASGTRPGGTLLFSTPGGIIIGSTAVFDVGSLVLTTLNVDVDSGGNFYDPVTRGFTFSPTGNISGPVTTEAGARINALSPNSYVALIAPTIDHEGNIQVNGAAAFVAGNQVTLRANDGLFDIIVPIGTGSAVPITHGGTTGGPASTGAADIHRIYMVAVPRNTAITNVLTGNIGFDSAVSASVENGAIVLSAGYNVLNGDADTSAAAAAGVPASFSINGGTITSRLTGTAVTDAAANGGGGPLHATQDLTLVGGQSATLTANAGETLALDRNVSLTSPGGQARIAAYSGSGITISGNATLDVTGVGFSPPKTGDAGTGQGGNATIYADGGSILISGDTSLFARGIGGDAAVGDYVGAGGNGYGGSILVQGGNGGSVRIGGNLTADASGSGGFTSGLSTVIGTNVDGATGEGGDITIAGVAGGSVVVSGSSTLSSNGQGGYSYFTTGGRGQGEDISIEASGGNVTLTGPVTVSATGTGGAGGDGGGDAVGGDLSVYASNGNVLISGATTADLRATGGYSYGAGAGGVGTGGALDVFALADTGGIDISSLSVLADGRGGASLQGNGGAGNGGELSIVTFTDQTVPPGPGIHFGALSLSANGAGGSAGNGGSVPAQAGAGTGGSITIIGSQAPIRVTGATSFVANGTGGASPTAAAPGATGQGGTISIGADRTQVDLGASAVIQANGQGGTGLTGGAGSGGQLIIEAVSGDVGLSALANFQASGTGGNGAPGSAGGGGAGGSVQILAHSNAAASHISGGQISIAASGTGGAGGAAIPGGVAGRGGNGTGGTVSVTAESTNGNLQLGALSARANGLGGAGGAGGGAGGDGFGGSVNAGTDDGPPPTCGTPAACAAATQGSARFAGVDLGASGTGGAGAGSTGGNGRGGSASLTAATGPVTVTGAATLAADGTAGTGTTRGRASGGTVTIAASANATTAVAASLSTGNLTVSAAANGDTAAGNPAGEWHVRASGGSTITLANANVTASSSGPSTGSATSTIEPNGGRVTVTGTGVFTTPAGLAVQATGTGSLTGGSVTLNGNRVDFSHTTRGTNATVDVTALIVNSATDFVAGAGTLTHGGTSADITARGTAQIAGQLGAPAVTIRSAEIDIPAGGLLGGGAGSQVTLQVLPAIGATLPNQVVLGGTTQGPGYTLTAAEAGRIGTGTLTLVVPVTGATAGRPPDLLVRDLTLNATGTTAFVGNLNLRVGTTTTGIAEIDGNLLLAGAGVANGISIQAGDRVQIVTPTGSVRVRDAAGAPAGTLSLSANDIWVTNAAIFAKLLADAGYATRDADLADNGGTQAPRGYVEGGTVTLATGNSLFVQNTGENPTGGFSLTGPAFGGITVGPGGLVIQSTGTTPGSVTAFGRRLNADGTTTTGYDFFFTVGFRNPNGTPYLPSNAPPTSFSAESTFNTCIVATGVCPGRVPDDTGPPGRDPVVGPFTPVPLTAPDDDPVDTSFATEPLIEEPVTSGGESSIWTAPCDPRQDRQCPVTRP